MKKFFETLQEIALGIGLAILIPMITHNGIGILYPTLSWSKYQKQYDEDIKQQKKTKHGKTTNLEEIAAQARILNDSYKEHRKPYKRVLFYTSLSVGLISIIIGSITKITSLGFGFVFGGIYLLVSGYASHWDKLSKYVRFSSLLLALILIIAMAYLLMRKRNK